MKKNNKYKKNKRNNKNIDIYKIDSKLLKENELKINLPKEFIFNRYNNYEIVNNAINNYEILHPLIITNQSNLHIYINFNMVIIILFLYTYLFIV